MRKSTIIIILVLVMLKMQAQSYLIDFAGTGETTVVGTVKVDNLTSGASVTLNGEDTLRLLLLVGIGKPDIGNGKLQVYPNPMAEQSILTFIAPEKSDVVISIVDISGRTIHNISTLLSSGAHSFRVSGISQGMYLLNVTGKNYHYSTKLISHSNIQGEAKIEDVSSENNAPANPLKNASTTIDMPYTAGDLLLFKGMSGTYSTIVTDVPTGNKTITFNFVRCSDYDGNNYEIVQIGSQTWMAENLRVTHYRNGESIPNVTDNAAWHVLTTGAYCWYNNDEPTYKIPYGALYNWYAGNDSRNLCPTGWHMPADAEWTILTDFLGGATVAGGKMKETGTVHWLSPNTGATNESGFTALAGGKRGEDGTFSLLSNSAFFWSTTEFSATNAWSQSLFYGNGTAVQGIYGKPAGFSVRCIKD